jgi:type III secretory pathway component EscV
MFRKVYRLVTSMADGPRKIHAGKGEFKEYDPSQWPTEAKIKVHVGNGSGDRETQLGQLQLILGMQREWIANYGLQNPIVTVDELHNTVEAMMRVMGQRSADQYFKDPQVIKQENPEALKAMMQPKPDPKAQEAQARMQADQAKAQQDARLDQQKADNQRQIEQMKAESAQSVAMFKAEQEAVLATQKAEFEAQMAQDKFEFEKEMARERAAFQREMEKEKMAAMPPPEANGGFRPGGRLDQ